MREKSLINFLTNYPDSHSRDITTAWLKPRAEDLGTPPTTCSCWIFHCAESARLCHSFLSLSKCLIFPSIPSSVRITHQARSSSTVAQNCITCAMATFRNSVSSLFPVTAPCAVRVTCPWSTATRNQIVDRARTHARTDGRTDSGIPGERDAD